MIEPIDRNEAIRRFDHMRELTADQVVDMLKRVPTADRPKGEWLNKEGVYGAVYCSECDYELRVNNTNFCPNCGADMRNDEDELTATFELTITEEQKQRLDKYKADMRGEDE